jgi:GxxExxY protein
LYGGNAVASLLAKFFTTGSTGITEAIKASSVFLSSPRGEVVDLFVTKKTVGHHRLDSREPVLVNAGESMANSAQITIPRVNQVSGAVVTAAIKVHTLLGPGLLESAYQVCLAKELEKRGLIVETQVGLPVVYEGEKLDLGYRIDLLVENLVIVEIKSVEAIHPVHEAQLLSYLRLSGKNVWVAHQFPRSPLKRRHQAHGRRQGLGQIKLNHREHRETRGKLTIASVSLCAPRG